MREYVSDAVVLDVLPNGDLDLRAALFTEKYGKLLAKAKSARKITSKLAGHLQPRNVVTVRLVEKNGLQVADAVKRFALDLDPPDLWRLNRLLPETEPERDIWDALLRGELHWGAVLAALGWDPREASCEACGGSPPTAFSMPDQRFFCARCALQVPPDDVLYI